LRFETLSDALQELDVFYGDLTANRAYVYARLPRQPEAGEWSLSGVVRGPRCLHAQTLPTVSRLIDLGPGATLLARATVVEPVFWSPDLPAIYDVTVKLHRGGEIVATSQREVGLRALGVRGNGLWLDGKNYVPRGVSVASATAELPRAWHDAPAMYVTDDRNLESLAEASQWGAMALVEVTVPPGEVATRLRELARYPAVAIAALAEELPADFNKKVVCPNLLLAQQLNPEGLPATAAWSDLLVVDYRDAASLRELRGNVDGPIIVRRRLPSPLDLSESRAACDALQREAAAAGQFAGYLV
jgi:hypothetical protein